MPLRRVVTAFIFILCCFALFGSARSAFALTACQCSCVDSTVTERTLTGAPAAGQTFLQKCQEDNKCGDKTISSAYDVVVTVSGSQQHRTACECVTPQTSTTLIKQSSGDSTCAASCEASCRSQGLSVNTAVAPIQVQTPCITDADCKTGVFAKYKGVTCKASVAANGSVTHACSVPVTGDIGKENANIECANYGGTGMTGATCDFVAAGDAPSSYLISRPYFQSSGSSLTYRQQFYTNQLVEDLWRALDTDGGISTTPGICYLYGTGEADYSNMNVTSALTQGVNGSKRYVCVKHKISVCGGAVKIDQRSVYPAVKNPFRYSCVPKSGILPAQQNMYCLTGSQYTLDNGQSVKGTDLCSTPNQICCASKCTLNAECGPYKVCSSDGQCVPKVECNSADPTWRCRTASAAEKANSSSCLPTLTTPLCQVSGQSCCAPLDAAALGSCAADLQTNPQFQQRYGSNGWKNFSCLTADQLTAGNQTLIGDWKSGGDCVIGDVAITSAENKAASRCGLNRRCCDVTKLAPAVVDELSRRPTINTSPCGSGLSFASRCMDPNSLVGGNSLEDYATKVAGFDSLDSYLSALGSSAACQATPVNAAGSPANTMECQTGGLCCYANMKWCDPAQANSCNAGETCHPQLHVCVPSTLVQQQLSSESCADRAGAAGDPSALLIASTNGVEAKDLSCQIVNSSDSQVGSKCAIQGCTASGITLSDGQEFRCCVPGTGQSPGATAQATNTAGGAPAAKSPSTIGLSGCIGSGQCTLDDILVTAANFANFLFKISGAIFLAIFVYAGFKYLTAGASNRGAKGLEMIKQASIGLVLLFAGYVLINFIQSSFISSATNNGVADKCGTTADTANMSCTFVPYDANDRELGAKIKAMGCMQGMCGGPANRVCCPSVKNP